MQLSPTNSKPSTLKDILAEGFNNKSPMKSSSIFCNLHQCIARIGTSDDHFQRVTLPHIMTMISQGSSGSSGFQLGTDSEITRLDSLLSDGVLEQIVHRSHYWKLV